MVRAVEAAASVVGADLETFDCVSVDRVTHTVALCNEPRCQPNSIEEPFSALESSS